MSHLHTLQKRLEEHKLEHLPLDSGADTAALRGKTQALIQRIEFLSHFSSQLAEAAPSFARQG